MSTTNVIGSVLGQGRRADEILIASSLEKAGTLRKGTVIAHDTVNETILLQIVDKITWADVSDQDLYLMSENEQLAHKILERSQKSYILRCFLIGALRDEGKGRRVYSGTTSFVADKTPEVRYLDADERKMIYDRGVLSVGKTVDDAPVTLPINSLLQRHLSVIGMTGCGKSYLLGLLCEELAKHKAAILIVDPHNEYISMAQTMPKEVNRMLYSVGSAANLNPYTLNVQKLSAQNFQHFTGMGDGSASILGKVIQTLRKTQPAYSITDIINALNAIVQGPITSEATAAMWARNYLQSLAHTGFVGTREPPMTEMVSPNQITVIAMSGVEEKIQQFVVTSLLQRIFTARRKNEICPLILIIEEAHRFAPSSDKVTSSALMRTLAAEGRKFGICLTVVSQRPNRLDSTVLSQCVTNIVMKVKNPADLASIRESAENVTEDVVHALPGFERGEALVMGEAFPVSIRFQVRSNRITKHGGKSIDYEGTWLKEATKRNTEQFEFPDEL